MTTETENPADFLDPALLAHVQQVQAQVAEQQVHKDVAPPDTTVILPGGAFSFTHGVETEAEVRELNGFDEEKLSREQSPERAMLKVLALATVRIGSNDKPTDADLDGLLMGDRNALLLGIRIATWGPTVTYEKFRCPHCRHEFDVEIDLTKDVEVRRLNGVEDREFEIPLRRGTALVSLPTGSVQREVLLAENKTAAELNSILLEHCVKEIDGVPVIDSRTVRGLGSQDRRTILTEITKRNPGPLLEEVKEACPGCSEEITFPLSVMGLFPLW